MPSSMPTWRNYGWLHEPLQNWAVKSPSPKRDIRRHCIVWSRDEMEKQREAFDRAGRSASPPQRPLPTPRHRRYAAPIDPAHAPYLPPGTVVRPAPQHAQHAHPQHAQPQHAQPQHARRPLEVTARWATPGAVPSSHPAPSSHVAPSLQAAFSPRDLVVGLMLVLATPLGVLLLWSGDRARETKVVSTVVAMMWMTAVTVVILAGILA